MAVGHSSGKLANRIYSSGKDGSMRSRNKGFVIFEFQQFGNFSFKLFSGLSPILTRAQGIKILLGTGTGHKLVKLCVTILQETSSWFVISVI